MKDDEIYEIVREMQTILRLVHRKIGNDSKSKEFTFPETIIINELKEGKVKTLTEISESLGIPNSTASFLIDRLLKKGMIKRKRDVKDKRKVIITIEDKALKLEKEINEYYIEHYKSLFKSAGKEELEAILNGLKILEKVMVESDVKI